MPQPIYDQAECARRYELIRLFPPRVFEEIWFKATDTQSFDRATHDHEAACMRVKELR